MQAIYLPQDGLVNVYNYKEGAELIKSLASSCDYVLKGNKKKGKQRKYLNILMSFDIETTTVLNDKWTPDMPAMFRRFSYTFCWQCMINDKFIFGRDPKEFFKMLDMAAGDYFIICNIHNITYEYNNLADFFEGDEIFFKTGSTPLFIRHGSFEFRCTAQLTHKSLGQLGESIGYDKLKGDFDYHIMRDRNTTLSSMEMNYCYRDVAIINKFVEREAMNYGGVKNAVVLPYTQTGYGRADIKQNFSQTGLGFLILQETRLTEAEYIALSRAFYGGFTHENFRLAGAPVADPKHYDLVSAYPAHMVLDKFPYSLTKVDTIIAELYMERLQDPDIAQIAEIEFTHLILKPGGIPYAPYSPANPKTYAYDAIEEAGRVMVATVYRATLCDVDMRLILDNYDYEGFEILHLWVGRKRALPKPVIRTVLKYFNAKTKYKGIDDPKIEYEYNLSKQKLNGLYGLTATALMRPEYEVGENLEVTTKKDENGRTVYKYKAANVMPYQWCIYITAYVREAIYGMISKLSKIDETLFIYSDTDSIFCRNDPRVDAIVEEYNEGIKARLRELEADYPDIMPVSPKGKKQYLGTLAEEEDDAVEFMTIGPKRYYLKHTDGFYDLTVSGLRGTKAIKDEKTHLRIANGVNTQRLIKEYGSVAAAFVAIKNGEEIELPYIENVDKLSNYVTRYDYEGTINSKKVSTKCSMTLYPVNTTLSLNGSLRHVLALIAKGWQYDHRDEIY